MKQYIISSIKDIFSEPLTVRVAAARNPSTRPSILAKLANDSDRVVRYLVSVNPNTPEGASIELPPRLSDETYNLAVDFFAFDVPNSTKTQIVSQARYIVESLGFECSECSWEDRAETARAEGEADADDFEGSHTLLLFFEGPEDDTETYSTAVQSLLCGLIEENGFPVEYSEFF